MLTITGLRSLTAGALCAGLSAIPVAQAASSDQPTLDEVRFGVPPWPGITVKSEVASQILEALGYQTKQNQLAVSVILNALANDDLDVYLAGWYPQEKHMLAPLLAEGSVKELVNNIPEVLTGIAVTDAAWQGGVRSIADLDDHAERFDHRIYGIEAGSGINDAVLKVIEAGRFGLDDWQLQASSSAAMLAQVGQKVERDEWTAFIGWQPHWMNIVYDMHYLEDVDDSGAAELKGHVATVVRADLAERDPDVARLFSQLVVDSEIQSNWVYALSYEQQDVEDIATNWIGSHQDIVATWLEGVEATDGTPGIEAVRAQFE
ncbi:glycine betaine/proline transport system substrate-binding protein [Modicisalibacter muralis]|uniref:Glycine betaine/proline transport system substrate-binding protein n=1 Tax=Modicisalibacter muralis TaxID=119000 RepID=A0A1G9RHT2_9GAMM|nr:ABC transporter substrate-binding protein [Halomonas muralis]SDM22882.1 glycine betaine/proline transport system substrate-binding protein [Halomonas muralis]